LLTGALPRKPEAKMSGNEEELEFISVAPDDDNELNNYMDPQTTGESSSVGGSWILNQSKVSRD
jgi:hypothetical protein